MNNNRYSDLKIVHFPDKVASFRAGRITAPIYVRIKPINLCNHHCWWCVYHSPEHSQMHKEMEARDKIPFAKMVEILDDLAGIGVKAVTYSGGGEPLIHPQAAEIMREALNREIDLSIITNGHFLAGDRANVLGHAKWVRVSMDYVDGEQLQKFRGVPAREFDKIMSNIRAFAQSKQEGCDLGVNFIVHKDNCNRLSTIAWELKQIGVENVRFSPMWVSPGFHEYHSPIRECVERELNAAKSLIDDTFSINTTYDLNSSAHSTERRYCKCFVMQTVPVIGADLNVYACHNKAYDKTGLIGSIKDRKFSDLWFSDEAKGVFESLNPQHVCQHQCSNDSKNILMHDLTDTHIDNYV